MTAFGDELTMLGGASAPDRIETRLGGGSIVAYSSRSPDKETENEDTAAAIACGPDTAVLVIADGAGGLPAGKRASQTAVAKLSESLQGAMMETSLLRSAILDGIEAANQAVLEIGNGSATTMTVVTIEGRIARTYQVGDSQAVIVGQGGRIKSQTMVHSPTGFAVEAGFLDTREALHHEDRHVVSNLIGTNDMHIDIGSAVKLRPRDTVLLASDGLTDNIHIDDVVNIIRKGPLNKAIESMTRLAHHRMMNASKLQPSKPDDLSVILFRKPYKR